MRQSLIRSLRLIGLTIFLATAVSTQAAPPIQSDGPAAARRRSQQQHKS